MATPSTAYDLKEVFTSWKTLLYLLGVVVTAVVGVRLCSRTVGLWDARALTALEIFAFLLLMTWFLLAVTALEYSSEDIEPSLLLFISVLVVPISGMFLQIFAKHHQAAFWLSLAIWTICGIFMAVDEAKKMDNTDVFLVATGAAWFVSGVIISAGTTSILPYSRSAIEGLRSVHSLLDIRYLLGSAFIIGVIVVAGSRAFRESRPVIEGIKALELGEPNDDHWIAWLIRPFTALINVLLLVISVIVDYLYKAARITALYFSAVGRNIAEILVAILKLRQIWIHVAELIGIFISIALAIMLVMRSCPFILEYARSSDWGAQALGLSISAGLVILVLLCVGFVFWIINFYYNSFIEPLISSFATIISIIFVAGLLLYALARLDFFHIEGFRVIGPFSALIVIFVLGGIGRVILGSRRRVTSKGSSRNKRISHQARVGEELVSARGGRAGPDPIQHRPQAEASSAPTQPRTVSGQAEDWYSYSVTSPNPGAALQPEVTENSQPTASQPEVPENS